jgi:peptidyl-prolyl cis-trans isomerase SurA
MLRIKSLLMTNHVPLRVAATLFLTLSFGIAAGAEIIEQILVKVNGEIFTKTDLETRQVAAIRAMGREADPSDLKLRQMLDEVTPDLLVNVVDEMLIVQRGKELGYRLGDEQFQSILDSIKKDNKIESEEQFQAALKQENMTLADLRKQLERQVIVSRVQQNEVLGRIAVSDDEARRYYESHLTEFTTSQSVTLREILVSVPSDGNRLNVGLDDEAQAKAETIRGRALAGEPFEKLAADTSDAPSRANAGLIGPLNLGDISADLRKLIETMKVGEISQVVRAQRGYQLLKLESMTAPETKPFDQAKEEISNRVFTDKRKAEFQKYIERLRTEAIIVWKNGDIKKAYEQGLAKAKTSATNQ